MNVEGWYLLRSVWLWHLIHEHYNVLLTISEFIEDKRMVDLHT